MIELQELIHKLEEGVGARYIRFAVVLLALLALTVIYDLREFKNMSTQEAMDTAQLARNIAEGKGYTTQFIRPLSLHLVQTQRKDRDMLLKSLHPDLANAPVYPVVLAGVMKLLPFKFQIPKGGEFWKYRYQPDLLIALFNQALFFLAIFLVFRLARRLFDAPVAWLSAAVLAGADLFWRFSVSGLSTMLLIVIFLGIVWCLVFMENATREIQRGTIWFVAMAILTGVLVGLGGLTRYSFGWLILPVLAFFGLFFAQRRLVLCLVAFAAFAAVLTPWLARNHRVSGNLFGLAGYALVQETQGFQSNHLERSLTLDLSQVELDEYLRKLLVNASEIVQNDLPKLGGSWLTAFFLVGLLVPFRNPALSRLRIFLLLSLAVLAVVQALGRTHLTGDSPEINSENLLVLAAPLVFVFGVGMYFLLLDQVNLPFLEARKWVTGAFGFLACLPLVFTLLPPRSLPIVYPPYYPPLIQQASNWMSEKEMMMSDMPWAVAWYGNRSCVWLTMTIDSGSADFFKINDYQRAIKAVYISSLTMDGRFYSQMVRSPEWAWGRFALDFVVRQSIPTGFPLKEAHPHFMQSGQIFMSDWRRWDSQPK